MGIILSRVKRFLHINDCDNGRNKALNKCELLAQAVKTLDDIVVLKERFLLLHAEHMCCHHSMCICTFHDIHMKIKYIHELHCLNLSRLDYCEQMYNLLTTYDVMGHDIDEYFKNRATATSTTINSITTSSSTITTGTATIYQLMFKNSIPSLIKKVLRNSRIHRQLSVFPNSYNYTYIVDYAQVRKHLQLVKHASHYHCEASTLIYNFVFNTVTTLELHDYDDASKLEKLTAALYDYCADLILVENAKLNMLNVELNHHQIVFKDTLIKRIVAHKYDDNKNKDRDMDKDRPILFLFINTLHKRIEHAKRKVAEQEVCCKSVERVTIIYKSILEIILAH